MEILQGRGTYSDACVAIKGYVRCVNPAKERYLERLRRGSFIGNAHRAAHPILQMIAAVIVVSKDKSTSKNSSSAIF